MNSAGKKVIESVLLIVEDFDAIRNLLGKYFQQEGYEVISVGRTQDVLLLGNTDGPQVVIVDLDLRADDPYHAISVIHEAFPHTYIVLMEGSDKQGIKDKAKAAGAKNILERKYDPTVLDDIVQNAGVDIFAHS